MKFLTWTAHTVSCTQNAEEILQEIAFPTLFICVVQFYPGFHFIFFCFTLILIHNNAHKKGK